MREQVLDATKPQDATYRRPRKASGVVQADSIVLEIYRLVTCLPVQSRKRWVFHLKKKERSRPSSTSFFSSGPRQMEWCALALCIKPNSNSSGEPSLTSNANDALPAIRISLSWPT